jgi:hypothetical protein
LPCPQVADGSAGLDDLAGGFKPGRKGKWRLRSAR